MSDSSDSENNYTDVVIVAEHEWHSRNEDCTVVCIYNTLWEIQDMNGNGTVTIHRVFCQKLLPERENCHAEVLFIIDNFLYKSTLPSPSHLGSSQGVIDFFVNSVYEYSMDRKEFKAGDFAHDYVLSDGSAVIRILEDKQKILKDFNNRSAADVTFVVNGEECKGDRMWMAAASPVFKAMLYGKFAEAQQDKILLEGIESAEIFNDFLLAVSPLRIQPNPSNVVALLKLAHQYDIPFLMRSCEDHLIRCYEIRIADRLLLSGKYGLDCLKVRITQQLSTDELKKSSRKSINNFANLIPISFYA